MTSQPLSVQHTDYPLYGVGLALAVTGCVSGGVMNVMVSRCRAVPRYLTSCDLVTSQHDT